MGKHQQENKVSEQITTSEIMRRVKGKNTKPEIAFRRLMRKEGIKGYRLHWKKAPGKPDIAFPGRKIAIFIHGCFWHRCPDCNRAIPKRNHDFWKNKLQRNEERDLKNLQQLHELGWTVLIVWECQIKKDPNIALEKLKCILM